MTTALIIPLNADPAQTRQLHALQHAFAEVCNALAPLARETRCWNRVALHHLSYRQLRARFPQLGSQMICNAIYSVSRSCRQVYQSPHSPFNLARLGTQPLPLLQFAPSAPVYFDRHTLSIKSGQLSMFSLDGRLRFQLSISDDDEQRFQQEKLREIAMVSIGDAFSLKFHFSGAPQDGAEADPRLPQYVLILTNPPPPSAPSAMEHAA